MKEPVRYSGPYVSPSGTIAGRRYMRVYYDDGSKGTTLYSRYLMELHLGRRLDPHAETVDHINDDNTDDRLENLQLLSRADNARKSARPAETMDFTCPWCLNDFVGSAKRYRDNQLKQGKSGPYCSRTCAAKARRRMQLDRMAS